MGNSLPSSFTTLYDPGSTGVFLFPNATTCNVPAFPLSLVGRPPPLPACLDGPRCPHARLCRPCLGVDRARVPGACLARAGPLVRADPRPCLAYSLARCLPAAVHAPPVPGARAGPRRADNFNAAYRKPHKNRTFPGFVEN